MYRICSNYFLFAVVTMVMGIAACSDPAGIEIIPPEDVAEFKAIGQIGDQPFAMEENVILITSSDNTNMLKSYGGQLFGECSNDVAPTCERSLTITFLDSINGIYNNDGYPVMLEPGVKDVHTGVNVSSTSPYLEIQPTDSSGLHINGGFHDQNHPYRHMTASIFPEFDYLSVKAFDSPVSFGSCRDVRVSLRDNELEYYYFKYNCIDGNDSIPTVSIDIAGNSSFGLDDFFFFNADGLPLNPENVFDSFIDPLLFEFIAVHRTYGDTTLTFSPIVFFPPVIDSTNCFTPFSAMSVQGMTVTQVSGIVLIEYRDESGSLYSSLGTTASESSFVINSTETFLPDEAGNQTVKSSLSFDGILKNVTTDEDLEFRNVEMTFGFGYLPE